MGQRYCLHERDKSETPFTKEPIKVSQFLGAIVSGMYNHLKSILKQNKHQVKCLLTF